MKLKYSICILGFFIIGCQGTSPQNDKYAYVFKPLDGRWKGKFYVYTDSTGQHKGKSKPANIDSVYLAGLPLKTEQVIDVEQYYESIDPFNQKVIIKDTYVDENDHTQIIESNGVNKVENGDLICIVNKPEEKIVHHGQLEDDHIIIWERHLEDPLTIEYFREIVNNQKYTIYGWGYYGNDDPTLTPKTWFYGDYRRVR